MNIYEKTFDDAFKSLSMQALADGYRLVKKGKKKPFTVVVEKEQERNSPYISCLDTAVHNVPAADLRFYLRSDSIKCHTRNANRDSLELLKQTITLPSARYRVSFFVVSSSFLQNMGIEWSSVFLKGSLHNIPDMIEEWTLQAVAADDTTAEFRSVELDLDSIATLHWGSQRKEEKSTVVYSNGVSQNDWEWRDYGLTLTLKREKKNGIRGEYQLAQRDENNSVLKGNFGGGGSDSIVAYGVYDSYQHNFTGIPMLYRIPIIGYLFGTESVDKVKSFFVIRIYKTSVDTVFHDIPYNDSLYHEDVKLYERITEDSTDNQPDTLDSEKDSLVTDTLPTTPPAEGDREPLGPTPVGGKEDGEEEHE